MSSFLHRSLVLDAAATGATAAILLAGGGLLAGPLGLPEALLRGAGLVLLPFVGFVAWTAMRDGPSWAVWTIIACNAGWVLASVALLLGWADPTTLGTAVVIAQAVVVGGFAELQVLGLRRARATA